MAWEVTGKVKIKQAMIPFLAEESRAFRKIDAQRREWPKESKERLSLWLEIQQQPQLGAQQPLPCPTPSQVEMFLHSQLQQEPTQL